MHGVEDQLPLIHMTEFPLLQGKSGKDIAGNKDSIGQLLLPMLATYLKHGKTVWGAALAPTKVNGTSQEIRTALGSCYWQCWQLI